MDLFSQSRYFHGLEWVNYFLQAVLEEDIPVAMASFSFVGVFALLAHLIADISYSYLDPRIRVKSQG